MAVRTRLDPKADQLRVHGTLHPNAAAVRDPAFAVGTFFDPRDLVQVKYEMLRAVQVDHLPVTDAVARFGLSRPTFYKAQCDVARAGLLGLLPTKRGPHGPSKLTPAMLAELEQRLAQGSTESPTALAESVVARFGGTVHPRTLQRALARSKSPRGASR
jgi:transposase